MTIIPGILAIGLIMIGIKVAKDAKKLRKQEVPIKKIQRK